MDLTLGYGVFIDLRWKPVRTLSEVESAAASTGGGGVSTERLFGRTRAENVKEVVVSNYFLWVIELRNHGVCTSLLLLLMSALVISFLGMLVAAKWRSWC